MRLRRRRAQPTVTVVYVSAHVTGHTADRIACTPLPLDVDRAHSVADEPLVVVRAYRWDGAGREEAWSIDVVALVEAEAVELLDAALAGLRADIDAGNVRRGAHSRGVGADPFDRREAVLAAFWRGQLRALESRAG